MVWQLFYWRYIQHAVCSLQVNHSAVPTLSGGELAWVHVVLAVNQLFCHTQTCLMHGVGVALVCVLSNFSFYCLKWCFVQVKYSRLHASTEYTEPDLLTSHCCAGSCQLTWYPTLDDAEIYRSLITVQKKVCTDVSITNRHNIHSHTL